MAEIEEKLNAATVNYDKLLKDAEDMQEELAKLNKKGGCDFAIFSCLLFASKMSEFEWIFCRIHKTWKGFGNKGNKNPEPREWSCSFPPEKCVQ